MQFSRTFFATAAAVALVAGLSGCASSKLIGVHEGADQVTLANASEVGSCQSKGKVTVSVMSEVGFITRGAEAVEANLLQLARNAAVDGGGDTVVKGNSTEYGKRTFEIYKCRK
jgi:hypothetical protein